MRLRQIVTLDQLHDEGRDAIRLFQPVDAADVWVIERRERSRFSLESSEPLRISEERLVEGS